MNKKTKETALILLRAGLALTLFAFAITNYDKLSSLDINALIGGIGNFRLAAAIVLGVYVVKALVFVVPASKWIQASG